MDREPEQNKEAGMGEDMDMEEKAVGSMAG